MPESVKRRGSAGPTIGATVRRSGVVAIPERLPRRSGPWPPRRSWTDVGWRLGDPCPNVVCGWPHERAHPLLAAAPRRRQRPRSLVAMVVRVRLFAQLRQRAGRSEIELELPDGARVRDALAAVADLADGLPLVMAVNREYAGQDHRLEPMDELALVPPVSGGADGGAEIHVRVTEEPLSLDAVAAAVRDPRAGGHVTFSGTTRDVS